MQIHLTRLAYFSPTGTTRTIAHCIAHGINQGSVEQVDLTRPESRSVPLRTAEDELLVVAVPVYIGRVPALLKDWLLALEAHNTPTVAVVVYGNRAYDDALLELRDTLVSRGCALIACAAYVGEHSFSSVELPTAAGRPDARDREHAALLGRHITEKMRHISNLDRHPTLSVPGQSPYRGDAKLWDVDFIAVSSECTQCGACTEVCPVGAIDPENSSHVDVEKCITCCACIKGCPSRARSMKPGAVKDAAARLHSLYAERKEPVAFL